MSVTDKTGIVDFARALDRLGIEILSTGGTHKALKQAGIQGLREVADVTGFPEMLDGRVKTIHPRIAAGILAIRAKLDHMAALDEHGIPRIDLVCVNLYEFEKIAAKKDATLEELIENIDIGGPTMIRAAAKNWQDVAVVTSPADYAAIIEELESNRGAVGRNPLAAGQESIRGDRGLRSRHRAAARGNSADGRRTSRDARHPRPAKIRAPLR